MDNDLARPVDAKPMTASRGRILLAEDDSILRDLGMKVLRKAGFEVDLAHDGEAAVDQASRQDYDLILMDGQMPRLDGLAASRQIRQGAGRNARTPIIAVTGQFGDDLDRGIQEAGINDTILKPYRFDQLLEKIDYWMDLGARARRPAAGGGEQAASGQKAECDGCQGRAEKSAFSIRELVERCLGNEDLAYRLLDKFAAQLHDALEMMRKHLEIADAPGLARVAHRIKGTAANLAVEAIRRHAEILEERARAGCLEGVAECLADMRSIAAQLGKGKG